MRDESRSGHRSTSRADFPVETVQPPRLSFWQRCRAGLRRWWERLKGRGGRQAGPSADRDTSRPASTPPADRRAAYTGADGYAAAIVPVPAEPGKYALTVCLQDDRGDEVTRAGACYVLNPRRLVVAVDWEAIEDDEDVEDEEDDVRETIRRRRRSRR